MSQVQFNLLPPSKMRAISARSQQAVMTQKATKAASVCAVLFILAFVYTTFIQPAQIKSAKATIDTKASALQKDGNLNTILTVDNQLKTAANLHQRQHDTSRLFDYLAKLTPLNASVGTVNLDLIAGTVKINGAADSASTVNAFIDSLKLAQFHVGSTNIKAFSSVVEDSFSISQNQVSFAITSKFDPRLFSNGTNPAPVLTVPNSTTVHSNDPGSLFGGSR